MTTALYSWRDCTAIHESDMAASRPAVKYLLSRYADPVFAISIGVCAALIRIRREEVEKGLGLPSASIVISPAQQRRMDEERERRYHFTPEKSQSLNLNDTPNTSPAARPSNQASDTPFGYIDVIKQAWEMIKWKVDYEWHDRRKESQRKDGRII